jgi:quercetin dioxygenase-like cupin family protein
MTVRTSIVIATTLVVAGIVAAGAQAPAFKRTVVQQGDLSTPGREVIQAVAEFQPGATPGRHTHAGEEVGYVLEGTLSVEQGDKPPVTLKAGQGFLIPAGQIHNATNTGSGVAKILATYIVEKGKPLATPAPATAK